MGAKIFKAVISMCLLALVAACGGGPSAEEPARTGTTDSAANPPPPTTTGRAEPTTMGTTATSLPVAEGVFFPRVKPTGGPISVPGAMGGGKLVLDNAGCLRMTVPGERPKDGEVPVWPPSFEAVDAGGGKVWVLDGGAR